MDNGTIRSITDHAYPLFGNRLPGFLTLLISPGKKYLSLESASSPVPHGTTFFQMQASGNRAGSGIVQLRARVVPLLHLLRRRRLVLGATLPDCPASALGFGPPFPGTGQGQEETERSACLYGIIGSGYGAELRESAPLFRKWVP